MASPDLDALERRVRRRYEVARAKRALLGAAPALALLLVPGIRSTQPFVLVALVLSLFVALAVFLWYGRELGRAVLPGLAAGLVPLVFSLSAHAIAHDCAGPACIVCVPVCAAGGSIAGAAVSSIGVRLRLGAGYWGAASILVLLTGTMGCACVGFSGVVGLLLGVFAGAAPVAIRARAAPHG